MIVFKCDKCGATIENWLDVSTSSKNSANYELANYSMKGRIYQICLPCWRAFIEPNQDDKPVQEL